MRRAEEVVMPMMYEAVEEVAVPMMHEADDRDDPVVQLDAKSEHVSENQGYLFVLLEGFVADFDIILSELGSNSLYVLRC